MKAFVAISWTSFLVMGVVERRSWPYGCDLTYGFATLMRGKSVTCRPWAFSYSKGLRPATVIDRSI